MRYTQPQITGTFKATFNIKSIKASLPMETGTTLLSTGPAYQADE